MGARRQAIIELTEVELGELRGLAARRTTAQAMALRARIVLASATGAQHKQVAAELNCDAQTVRKWRGRFIERRIVGLRDEPRSGAPRTIDDQRIETVIVRTLESTPPDATHWSSRGMARASGLSVSTVQRVWRAFDLQPHRVFTVTGRKPASSRAAVWRRGDPGARAPCGSSGSPRRFAPRDDCP